jgi:release factor glutamine methyltransferase
VSIVVEAAKIGALRRRLATRLADAFAADGREGTPELDARLLLGHVLGLDATAIVLAADRPVDEADVAHAMALAERRIAGEPVARIVGEKEFWSLPLRLSPATLVPRPDTEVLVAAALAAIDREGRRDESLSLLDLGTGTGAILLALLSELPAAFGVGVDIAEGAATMARRNAAALGLGGRAALVVSDWTEAIGGRFDLIVSNPPYIPTEEISGLAVEVSRHDPDIALDGGSNGLAAHRAVLDAIEGTLADRGLAFIEVGAGQSDAVAGLAESRGFDTGRHIDLAGIERVVKVRRGKRPR